MTNRTMPSAPQAPGRVLIARGYDPDGKEVLRAYSDGEHVLLDPAAPLPPSIRIEFEPPA